MDLTQLVCGLLACLGVGVQIQETRQEWHLAPRWSPGLEVAYCGRVEEHSTAPGVAFQRTYALEVRMLVLEFRRGQASCAFLTRLVSDPKDAGAVRVENAHVEELGRIIPPDHAMAAPPDGPMTWEHGFVVEVPRPVVAERARWFAPEPGRPLKQWEVLGPSAVAGMPCVMLRGVQESEDWKTPRADRTAWQITETVWISSRTGLTHKVERVLLRRPPARQEPDYRTITTYELESSLQYDGSFLAQRRRDVEHVTELAAQVRAMKDGARQATTAEWKTLLGRIEQLLQQPGGTSYREGVTSLRTMALAASENRLLGTSPADAAPGRLSVGQPAPEFVTQHLGSEQTVTLKQWRGKVVLMAFFLPQSERAAEVLLLLQKLQHELGPDRFMPAALAMTDDKATLKKLQTRLGLTLPMLAGKSLRHGYEVTVTPRFVLLDTQGRVLLIQVGWGPETLERLHRAVRASCQPAK